MVIITEVATGAKFTGKDLCQSLFAEVCKFIKKETLTQVFFCKLFSHRTPSTAASISASTQEKLTEYGM